MRGILTVVAGCALAYVGVVPGAVGACVLDSGCEDYRALSTGWAVALLVTSVVISATGLTVAFRAIGKVLRP